MYRAEAPIMAGEGVSPSFVGVGEMALGPNVALQYYDPTMEGGPVVLQATVQRPQTDRPRPSGGTASGGGGTTVVRPK
jgi:hypothetical protein